SGKILDGQETATVTIKVAGDKIIEPDESFALALNLVDNGNPAIAVTLGANLTATGTILNDDGFIVHTGDMLTTPQTLVDGNTGTVQFGGVFSVSATGNISAVTWTGGTVTIDNAGLFSASSITGNSRAIDTGSNALADGSSLMLTNEATGHLLSSTNDA